MAAKKVFYAHPKGGSTENPWIEDAAVLAALFEDAGIDAEVITGHEDFYAHVREEGGWAAWSRSIPVRYNIIVVPAGAFGEKVGEQHVVGKATRDIIEYALEDGLQVLLWDRTDNSFTPITGTAVHDVDNTWSRGWLVITE